MKIRTRHSFNAAVDPEIFRWHFTRDVHMSRRPPATMGKSGKSPGNDNYMQSPCHGMRARLIEIQAIFFGFSPLAGSNLYKI